MDSGFGSSGSAFSGVESTSRDPACLPRAPALMSRSRGLRMSRRDFPSSFGPLRGIRPVGDMMESSESASKCRTRVDTSLTKDGVTSAWLPCDELSESIRDPFTRVGARTGGTGLFLCEVPECQKTRQIFQTRRGGLGTGVRNTPAALNGS